MICAIPYILFFKCSYVDHGKNDDIIWNCMYWREHQLLVARHTHNRNVDNIIRMLCTIECMYSFYNKPSSNILCVNIVDVALLKNLVIWTLMPGIASPVIVESEDQLWKRPKTTFAFPQAAIITNLNRPVIENVTAYLSFTGRRAVKNS